MRLHMSTHRRGHHSGYWHYTSWVDTAANSVTPPGGLAMLLLEAQHRPDPAREQLQAPAIGVARPGVVRYEDVGGAPPHMCAIRCPAIGTTMLHGGMVGAIDTYRGLMSHPCNIWGTQYGGAFENAIGTSILRIAPCPNNVSNCTDERAGAQR